MDTIKHMVNRFLGWKLPATFRPDGGISFKADYDDNTSWPAKHEPYGTNLFDATQAEAMVRYMLEGLSSSDSAAMEALRELVACDEWRDELIASEGALEIDADALTARFSDAFTAARALLAAPIAPVVEQEK